MKFKIGTKFRNVRAELCHIVSIFDDNSSFCTTVVVWKVRHRNHWEYQAEPISHLDFMAYPLSRRVPKI
jgi:hypothetical protein